MNNRLLQVVVFTPHTFAKLALIAVYFMVRLVEKCVSCNYFKVLRLKKVCYTAVLLFFLILVAPVAGYSLGVLTHEAIIDAAWDNSIVPLLRSRYPRATAEDLKTAHAYAYGGAVSPDMGYYPFGSRLFTNLVHYVRSGDMVDALLKDAADINQYAFALGFLSHYYADNYGHPIAINRSVPLVYRRMKRKYGELTTYEQNKISHIRMELGFDVLQTSKGNYASQAYHDFIGFKVDTAVLGRAFLETYGLDINTVFGNHLQFSIEVFRFTVANIFPIITRSAWASKSSSIIQKDKTATSRSFRYRMRIREYNKEYGKGYKRPGFGATMLSLFIRVFPKVGPTRALRFKAPNAQAENYFDQAFDTILHHYNTGLQHAKATGLRLKDDNFDTGRPAELCEYSLADATCNEWLLKLQDEKFAALTPGIRSNIVTFYGTMNPPGKGRHAKKCNKIYDALQTVSNSHPVPNP
jgi:Zinc dependent phospholipase C